MVKNDRGRIDIYPDDEGTLDRNVTRIIASFEFSL